MSWLIIGSCTGSKQEMEALCQRYPALTLMPWGKRWTAQPRVEWVKEIVEVADRAGIPVFLKNNLRPILKNAEGWTPAWAVSAREPDGSKEYLRQEIPE